MTKTLRNESNDEIDNLLFNFYQSDKFDYVPNLVSNGIDTAMFKYKTKKVNILIKIRQIIITIMSILTLTSSVVFAKDIKNFFNNIFNDVTGISTAISNGYINNPDIEYAKSNNINIKVDSILMDDYNLCINFKIDFSNLKYINLSNITEMNFKDLLILDENNTVIFSSTEDYLNNYCTSNNINNVKDNSSANINHYINNIDSENKTCTLTYNLANSNKSFPKSKNLKMKISELELNTRSENTEKIILNYDNEIKLDIPEKFYSRQVQIYTMESASSNDIILNEATVYQTGTHVEFDLKTDKEINLKRLQEAQTLVTNGNYLSDELSLELKNFFNPFANMYITDSNNKKYSLSHNVSEDNVLKTDKKGHLIYSCSFDLTKYDATDNLKLHFTYDSNEIIVNLKRITN